MEKRLPSDINGSSLSEKIPVQTLDQIRDRLDSMREHAKAKYAHAEEKRDQLIFVEEPRPLSEVQQEREQEIFEKTLLATKFTDVEKERIKFYDQQMTSWNPLQKAKARRQKGAIFAAHERREKDALVKAFKEFRENELPQMKAAHEESEQRYDGYEVMSYLWEDEMRDAEEVFGRIIPAIEEQLVAIERVGLQGVKGINRDADLEAIEGAISRCYAGIPKATREAINADRIREVMGKRAWGREYRER